MPSIPTLDIQSNRNWGSVFEPQKHTDQTPASQEVFAWMFGVQSKNVDVRELYIVRFQSMDSED